MVAGFGFSTTSRRSGSLDGPEGGGVSFIAHRWSGYAPRRSDTRLFKPQTALRVRANLNTDTPLPPDEPAGENPPDGAMIDYFLSKDASGPVTIEIKDGKGQLVRKYSSTDKPVAGESEAAQNSELLDSAAAIGFHKSRHAPVSVGHALHTDRRCGTGVSDFGDVSQHGAAGNIALGRAG